MPYQRPAQRQRQTQNLRRGHGNIANKPSRPEESDSMKKDPHAESRMSSSRRPLEDEL